MSDLSEIVGHVTHEFTTWEVWSNGRAYGDRMEHPSLYRWQDGTWRGSMTRQWPPNPASERIEAVFQRFLNGIIVGPVDPLRHLRKK